MSGYVHCGCRDCFEITIGEPDDFCDDCVTAGCEPDCECRVEDTDDAWAFCDKCKTHIDPDADNGVHECNPDLVCTCDAANNRYDVKCPQRCAQILGHYAR